MTLLQSQPCLVLIDHDGNLGWLGQFPDAATAQAAMEHWLAKPDRDDEDAAFILPVIGFGRPDLLARAAADKGEAE
jgi:trehalose-6-phosphatase